MAENHMFWNRIQLRHKILFVVIIASLLLFRFIPIILYIDFIYIIFYIYGWMYACPSCESFLAKQSIEPELVESRNSFRNETKEMTISNKRGNITETSCYHEKIPIVINKYKDKYACKYCDYVWYGKEKIVEEEIVDEE
jgi:hypothetical protein